ncbi:MAG TPA: GNAT family N-acetyltransferase [Gaiellaceae bacterium]|nr:GNAT family N-acetyltransferase [Gaiellaceae bacterium]
MRETLVAREEASVSRLGPVDVEFRRATEDDLRAEYEVFLAAQGELLARHGFGAPQTSPESFAKTHGHLLTHDGERSFVAEAKGRIIAFCAAFVRDDTWFLSAMFVLPEIQGRGVGKRLLDLSWSEGDRRRLTITESIQPLSNGLYARRGLVPLTPILALAGEARADDPRELEAGIPDRAVLAVIDRDAYGFERRVDHDFWASEAECTLWYRDGAPVAYSYVSAAGGIGPLASRDQKGAASALRAELARLSGAEAAVTVPGSARELVEVALAAGLRFESRPGLLLVSSAVQAPTSLAISSYWLL